MSSPTPDTEVRPGTTFPVEAGLVYVLVDENGERFEIEAREASQTIALLRALDDYILIRANPIIGSKEANDRVLSAKWKEVTDKMATLPQRIRYQMEDQ